MTMKVKRGFRSFKKFVGFFINKVHQNTRQAAKQASRTPARPTFRRRELLSNPELLKNLPKVINYHARWLLNHTFSQNWKIIVAAISDVLPAPNLFEPNGAKSKKVFFKLINGSHLTSRENVLEKKLAIGCELPLALQPRVKSAENANWSVESWATSHNICLLCVQSSDTTFNPVLMLSRLKDSRVFPSLLPYEFSITTSSNHIIVFIANPGNPKTSCSSEKTVAALLWLSQRRQNVLSTGFLFRFFESTMAPTHLHETHHKCIWGN